jgi:hypothetical protein
MHLVNRLFRYRRREYRTQRLLAWSAVVETARSLGDLLLCDCDDVDGDGVELESC